MSDEARDAATRAKALGVIQDITLRILNEDDLETIRKGLEMIESICRFGQVTMPENDIANFLNKKSS